MMSLFSFQSQGADESEFENLVCRCRSDRNELFAQFRELCQERGDRQSCRLLPTAIVRDIIRDVCGYFIHERPLPRGQSALCDFRTRCIKLNSKPGSSTGKDEELLAWQRCILAHELAHIRLHTDEMEEGTFISIHHDDRFDDPRFFQKEYEADFYAAIFLVPAELLDKSKAAQKWRERLIDRQANKSLSSEELWRMVGNLAQAFGTTKSLMRLALEIHGWVAFRPKRRYSNDGLLQLALRCD